MKKPNIFNKSVDELWALHEQVARVLSAKILEEKAQLEKKLRRLSLEARTPSETATPSGKRARRPYPAVLPKFRNPLHPAETWAGRGKRPRWLLAQLKRGRQLDEFRIRA
jgi:DNA-binding protein H-NS